MGLLNEDNFLAQVAVAQARLGAVDISALSQSMSNKTPRYLASAIEKEQRRNFLGRSLGDADSADKAFERIINGNELQDVAYLERGLVAARAVCRVVINGNVRGYGTGFLIAPGVLLTNNHVLPDDATAAKSRIEFNYERDRVGNDLEPVSYRLDPATLFHTNQKLDFTVVSILPRQDMPIGQFGYCPLVADAGKVMEGEWLTIIQHPGGERKQVCVRENRLIYRGDDVLWYTTDTLAGSSGAPVYNNDWLVVALHHSGKPEEKDGVIQTIHGRPFVSGIDSDADIKWIANEGIRASRIVEALRLAKPDDPLLQPVFQAKAENVFRIITDLSTAHAPAVNLKTLPKAEKEQTMSSTQVRSVSVTLDIADDGSVRLRGASPLTEATGSGAALAVPSGKPEAPPVDIDVPFDATYKNRKGFMPEFLAGAAKVDSKLVTPLPDLIDTSVAARLLDGSGHILHYHGMSVVMNKTRRFAIYSAANVDFANRFEMGRPSDRWLTDPRISAKHQIGEFYYRSNNFDRGHLTRREDMEYGQANLPPRDSRSRALEYAADTCHFTNCVPQHSRFNQSKELWQGLERHLLEDAIKSNSFRAQLFTGPILEEDDPVYSRFPDIQYPVRFWKIAVAAAELNGNQQLFAAGFIMDQSEVIAKYGIEATIPFEPYKTYQVKIEEIERLTGLTFPAFKDGSGRLSNFDPMSTQAKVSKALRRGQSRPALQESIGGGLAAPTGYVPLTRVQDIVI